MATVYGLTSTGFVPKTMSVVRADLDAAMRAAFGASMALGDKSVLGQVDAIMAERYAELWALGQAIYASQDPDAASGLLLDAICKLTGTLRPRATYSSVAEVLTGSPGSTIPSGTIVAAVSTGVQFKTTANAGLAAVAAWAGSTLYTANTRVTNGGNVYQCTAAGTSASTGGPTTTAANIVDGGATWTFLGIGTGAVDVILSATVTGPVFAAARDATNTNITPVAGLSGAINLLDSSLGAAAAPDPQLRLLREAELSGEGAGTADAISAALIKLPNVTTVSVFVNDADVTDADGVPPHAVQCMVQGGADADIAAAIFAEVSAGIATSGTASQVVTDSQGVTHTVHFQRPTLINIYVDVTVSYDASAYPTNGDVEVQAAIAQLSPTIGLDVRASKIIAAVFGVAGVLDVSVLIGTAPSPASSTTISIDLLHLAVFDTSRVTVHSSAATP